MSKIETLLNKTISKKTMNNMKDSLKMFLSKKESKLNEEVKDQKEEGEEEDVDIEYEDIPEETKESKKLKLGKSPMKTRRQLQEKQNYELRKELRKTFVPTETEIHKMKLPEIQELAIKKYKIDINNKESGTGKGKGHKSIKTKKQLITEIEDVRAKNGKKEPEKSLELVFNTPAKK